jgi:hypothetical protein
LFHRMLENITRRYTQLLTAVNESPRDLKNAKSKRDMKRSKDPSLDPLESLSPHVSKDSSSDAPLDILSASNELFSSELNCDTYSTFRDKMPAFQYSLQVMEEGLKDTFEKIDFGMLGRRTVSWNGHDGRRMTRADTGPSPPKFRRQTITKSEISSVIFPTYSL